MKIRIILAAAAAPAALAVALLGTGTAAHAAVTPATRTLVTNEHHVTDTTSVPTGKMDPSGGGPIWAYDDLSRIVTVTPDAQAPGSYDVSISTVGYAHPFANPITGKAWHPKNDNVYMLGSIRYVVTPPSGVHPVSHLPVWTSGSYRSGGVLNEAFGLPRDSSALVHQAGDAHYSFTYFGVPGAPNGGLYSQVG